MKHRPDKVPHYQLMNLFHFKLGVKGGFASTLAVNWKSQGDGLHSDALLIDFFLICVF